MKFTNHVTFEELLSQVERDPVGGPVLVRRLSPLVDGLGVSPLLSEKPHDPADGDPGEPYKIDSAIANRIVAVNVRDGRGDVGATLQRLHFLMAQPVEGPMISDYLGVCLGPEAVADGAIGPVGKLNWANIIAIIMQILAALGGGVTPPAVGLSPTFATHKADFKAKLTAALPVGTALSVIDALVAVVEKDWTCLTTIITDVQGALNPPVVPPVVAPPAPVK
jgi:hypothetical protein